MRVVFVHGACVRDGAWWWGPTGDLLGRAGITSAAAALPSCGEGPDDPGAAGPGLQEDVAVVRRLLEGSDAPTLVVAHNYGGIVVAQAAVDVGSVRHVLMIASYLAEPGESLASFGADGPAPFLDVDPVAGTFGVRPELLEETFLQDCRELMVEASERLARQSLKVVEQPVRAAVWGRVPATYLVCADDRATPAERQRELARRADGIVEIDAGHHPFLSQPAFVRDLALSLLRPRA
jgi:pimeloyl-ACP methyl ester carboxylesterase